MKLFKNNFYKNKFKQSSLPFPEYSLKTFNVKNLTDLTIKKRVRGKIIFFNKFKTDEKTLKLQQIKAEIIKFKKNFNLINFKYKDLTTKQSKKGTFKLYLNSPVIYSIN